jgi:hypothetical protein
LKWPDQCFKLDGKLPKSRLSHGAVDDASLSCSQVLQQAGTAMVAQANQLPQGVLALLR